MPQLSSQLVSTFFLQISVMLTMALLCGQMMRRINQPAVLGELLGGILLGPTVLGMLFPDFYVGLFPAAAEVTQGREAVIRIGMVIFLFVAGLEVNLTQIQQQKQRIFLIGFLGCLLPFLLGFGSVWLFPSLWSQSNQADHLTLALFIGTALSISALPVITRILMDLKLLHQEFGSVILSAATISDLVGWALFALLLSALRTSEPHTNGLTTLGGVFIFSLVVLAFGYWIGQPVLRSARRALPWPSGFLGVSIIFILVSAAIAETLHVHAVFGAFLVGVALNPVYDHEEGNQAKEIVYQFVLTFFAPLYFVSVGLMANFALYFDGTLVLLVIVVATIGKVLGCGLGARLSGSSYREALATGFAMNARGAMEIILAAVALEQGLIDQRIFVALVTMALVTSMLSGPVLQWLLRIK